jgi:putative DNA primase/helicase
MKCTTTAGPQEEGRLEAALPYAELGWAVFPVHSAHNGVCTCRKGAACGATGKHPSTRHGVGDATTDPEKIKAWWNGWPDANIGVATGEASAIVVLCLEKKGNRRKANEYRYLGDL